MKKKILLTKQGLQDLREEYEEIKNKKRPYAVKRLATAKSLGDLSENSEYSAAIEELTFIDGRIDELEDILRYVEVVSAPKKAMSTVQIGSQVTVRENGNRGMFHIVGEWEANPREKKISHTSPLGIALLGKKKGETVEVHAPMGKVSYKIVEVK